MKNCKNLPAEMSIDYIRLWQDPGDESHFVGCSPRSHPTETYIKKNKDLYANWRPYKGVFKTGDNIYFAVLRYLMLAGLVVVGVYFAAKYLKQCFTSDSSGEKSRLAVTETGAGGVQLTRFRPQYEAVPQE
jgi:hypothetical protein